jgi:hypothetical protein
MGIAEHNYSQMFPGANRAESYHPSASPVANADSAMSNEIGVITGVRRIIVQVDGGLGENELGPQLSSTHNKNFDQGGRWIEITPTNRTIALVLRTRRDDEAREEKSGHDPNCPILLKCEDVHRTHRDLVVRGVRFSAPPAKLPFGWLAILEDDEGRSYLLGEW